MISSRQKLLRERSDLYQLAPLTKGPLARVQGLLARVLLSAFVVVLFSPSRLQLLARSKGSIQHSLATRFSINHPLQFFFLSDQRVASLLLVMPIIWSTHVIRCTGLAARASAPPHSRELSNSGPTRGRTTARTAVYTAVHVYT